jgi:DNA recombination protein RmuC
MDNVSWFWPLLVILAVPATALIVLMIRALARLREMGETVRNAGEEMSAGIRTGQIEALKNAQEQMDRISGTLQNLQGTLDERLKGQQELLSQQLSSSTETVAGIKKELGVLSEATGQIRDIGRDIASLEDILSSPKLRGGVGEIFLEKLLDDIFPKAFYDTQHTFANGVTVDAIIRIGEMIVPIDSKFPIEDFRRVLEAGETDRPKLKRQFLRNVEKKVDDIAAKYIQPDEGTFNFALMYIPAENIYYETIVKDESEGEGSDLPGMLHYAVTRRVIPVSPNSFYAYLQVILYGLKGMDLERRGDEILAQLQRLQGELDRFSGEYAKLGTHLKNAAMKYDDGRKRLVELDAKLKKLDGSDEPPVLELPSD